jgi:hypothetical protein
VLDQEYKSSLGGFAARIGIGSAAAAPTQVFDPTARFS